MLRRIGLGIVRRLDHARRHAHFLHAFPLLGSDDHQYLWHECIVLHGPAHKYMICDLNIRHRHAFAALAQRSLLVQLQCLRELVRPQHGDFGRIHGLYFAKNEIFSELATAHHHHSAARTSHARTTRPVASAPCYQQRREVLIPTALYANKNHVTYFEIRELCVLAVLVVLGLVSNFDGDVVSVGFRQLKRAIFHCRNLSEDRPATSLVPPLPPACFTARPSLLSGRGSLLCQGGRGREQKSQNPEKGTVPTHVDVLLGRLAHRERRTRRSKSNRTSELTGQRKYPSLYSYGVAAKFRGEKQRKTTL